MAPAKKVILPTKERALFSRLLNEYETKKPKLGLKTAESILKKFPDHAETLSMKGLLLSTNFGKKVEGMDLAKKGLMKDLTSFICWHVLGILHRADKNFIEAIKCYQQGLRIEPVSAIEWVELELDSERERERDGEMEREGGSYAPGSTSYLLPILLYPVSPSLLGSPIPSFHLPITDKHANPSRILYSLNSITRLFNPYRIEIDLDEDATSSENQLDLLGSSTSFGWKQPAGFEDFRGVRRGGEGE